jgi:cell division protein FtsL
MNRVIATILTLIVVAIVMVATFTHAAREARAEAAVAVQRGR